MAAGIPCQNWVDCFEADYNQKTLLDHENRTASGFHTTDEPLGRLNSLSDRLSKAQIDKIRNVWDAKRDGLFHFQTNFNLLYNLRGSKGHRRNSLRKIIKQDFDLFTSTFPVILTNPSTANTLFPPKVGLFDFVIFDEASQLRIEDTFANLVMGRRKVVSGDEHQMPPSSYFASEHVKIGEDIEDDDAEPNYNEDLVASESLLQYAEKLIPGQSGKSYLDYHYRSQHPDLVAFSNATIYGNNLIPLPAKSNYNPIDFQNIGGTYRSGSYADSNLRNTNKDEAESVLKILKDNIEPGPDGKYPSVGIVTFNIPQRNLIDDTIGKETADNPDFAAKYQSIKESGFFLRSVESVQGDERDVIIICTTFGPQEDGKFRQYLGSLNYPNSYRLLNVFNNQIQTKNLLSEPQSQPNITGSYQNWLAMTVKSCSMPACFILNLSAAIGETKAYNLLQALSQNSHEKPREANQMDGLTESPFEEEVYQELKEIIPDEQIQPQFKIAGFRLDFLIGTNIVLECDGKTYHKSEEAYKHDMYRQKELEKQGLIFYRIWSTNWFRDKESETKRFSRILSIPKTQGDNTTKLTIRQPKMTRTCPRCEQPMIRRTAGKGQNKGNGFWGCSRFPKCWGKIHDDKTTNGEKAPTDKPATRDRPPNEPDDVGHWDPDKRLELLKDLHERDGGLCGICGREVSLVGAQVEHIVPKVFGYFSIQKGGKAKIGSYYKSLLHETNNLQLAHPQCNKHKGNKVDTKLWRHPVMPPLRVAFTEDGQGFTLPYKKFEVY